MLVRLSSSTSFCRSQNDFRKQWAENESERNKKYETEEEKEDEGQDSETENVEVI